MNRRNFLTTTTKTTGAGLLILPSAQTAFAYKANEALNLAVVGISGYGARNGFALGIHTLDKVRFGLSCDVDLRKVQRVYDDWDKRVAEWSQSGNETHRQAVKDHYAQLAAKHPPLMSDFRRMLDAKADEIDAVVVATPDHTHANISAAALRAGKPVFSEKPLTIRAHEARALHKLARETKLPTQMNTHGAQHGGFRRGVEVIREGVIGEIRHVHFFLSRGGRDFTKAPQGPLPIPKELNWDLWLAQLKNRDYHEDWINRIAWRESSVGELGNLGTHDANMAFMALNVGNLWTGPAGGEPVRIRTETSGVNQLSYPEWERIHWQVPPRGDQGAVTFTWHHGPLRGKELPQYAPGSREMLTQLLKDHGSTDAEVDENLKTRGCLILGSKGLLATGGANTRFKLFPVKELRIRRAYQAAVYTTVSRSLSGMGQSLSGQ